jgi:UDP-N-acetyl-2-amino-2-deoxyglucuronate dehydrogenase
VRLALRLNAHAICEKPLVVNPWNLDALAELEAESDCRVYNVLQLRLLPTLIKLKQELEADKNRKKVDVTLSYVTRRGPWYHASWKGEVEKSGGVIVNIGIHFFDFLIWMFGKPEHWELHMMKPDKVAGFIEFEWARVRWLLSVDKNDLPPGYLEAGKPAFRSLTMDGKEIEFSEGFTDLHTTVYKDILAGGGFGLADARPAIELVHRIRTSSVLEPKPNLAHPHLKR